ncbi:WD40 repeat domain-containing protein [Dapis sp. BLCC M126]|uniref:WD40 repeat domain-containing protein n=1 Tax=Dapis sp. BLCC M126 TaxID=3400189 RepID=UPI003CF30407
MDAAIRLWDANTGECLQNLRGHIGLIWAVVFSPDGKQIASCGDDESIMVWDVNAGCCRQTFRYPNPTEHYQGGIWTVTFSPCSQLLASGDRDSIVKIWNIDTGNFHVLSGHDSWIWKVEFSHDGKTLASSSDDKTIKIWDVESDECLYSAFQLSRPLNSLLGVRSQESGD